MSNFLTDNDDRRQRKVQRQYWEDRYQRAEPIMKPDVGQFGDNYPRCGDEGLKVPKVGLKGDELEAFKQSQASRHENMSWQINNGGLPAEDRKRLGLTMKAEKSALSCTDYEPNSQEGRQAAKRYEEALGNLVTYDAKMGHPVSDQSRDLQTHPVTQEEQLAWMHRNGREMTREDLEHRNLTSMYDIHSDLGNKGHEVWKEHAIDQGRFDLSRAWHNQANVGEPMTSGDMLKTFSRTSEWVKRDADDLEVGNGPAFDREMERRKKIGINLDELSQGKQRGIQH